MFQFRDSCFLLSNALSEDFLLLEGVLISASASIVNYLEGFCDGIWVLYLLEGGISSSSKGKPSIDNPSSLSSWGECGTSQAIITLGRSSLLGAESLGSLTGYSYLLRFAGAFHLE